MSLCALLVWSCQDDEGQGGGIEVEVAQARESELSSPDFGASHRVSLSIHEPTGHVNPDSLPPSARQTREGYWVGAMFQASDVRSLARLGIQVVLSAVRPDESTLEALREYGVEQIDIPLSNYFRHADVILRVTERVDEDQIYIHCRHGADRAGVITAFLLVMRHGWLIQDAFYSVLNPTSIDAHGLAEILERYDLPDRRAHTHESVGFYSVAATGRSGGLKARAPGYVQLIESTLQTIESLEGGVRSEGWLDEGEFF